MAYPYYPPYYFPYQSQAPVQIQQPTVQPPQMQSSGIIWVSGAQEAAMYPIAPNNAVALWEKSGKTIYLKQADATGKPTMTVYDLVERTQTPSDGLSDSDSKIPTYATKDDLRAAMDAVEGIGDAIASLRMEMDTVKGDLYGIAGKKKVKKDDE